MIYFVEDDNSIRELVVYSLNGAGYEALGFSCGKDFFAALEPETAELVLLDIMLPGEDGIVILKKLRAGASTAKMPVIMVSAMGTEIDKVVGLDSGADDYISKPFGVMELLARVRAVLRRSGDEAETLVEDNCLTCGTVTLYPDRHSVTVGGEEVALTPKEFDLLHHLLRNRKLAVSRDKLLDAVWGYDCNVETRTVDVHVRTLRQKLGADGDIITTVRGVGYKIGGDV